MNSKTIFLKTAFLLACLIAGSLMASAYTCEVDGIYYNISGSKATVTYKNSNYNSYSGDIVIPDTIHYNGVAYPVTSIGTKAFYGSSGLISVEIPNSVTTINKEAFRDCGNMTRVSIGNSVNSIDVAAFHSCNSLSRVDISDIEAWCKIYFDCASATPLCYAHHIYLNGEELSTLEIPSSISKIRDYTFYGCASLNSVSIPNSVTSIGVEAFSSCEALTNIDIPNTVTRIEYKAFEGCKKMESISIPSSMTFIGYDAFYGCTGLTRVDITDLESWCNLSYPSSYSNEYSNPLKYAHHLYLNGTEITHLEIPNSITAVQRFTFNGCSGLKSVTLHNAITAIGEKAFADCSGMTSVTIPNSVKSLGASSFYGCSSLTTLVIPNSVTAIGASSFNGCSALTSVSIPNSITTIESGTFSGCKALTSLSIPNSVTTIGNSAFSSCSGLKSVTIPNTVSTIGYHAFFYCSSLTSVTIPNSVNSIGYQAFMNCTALTNVEISNSISTIEYGTFNNCKALTSVSIPSSVTEIKNGSNSSNGAFSGCTSLSSIIIPNSVKSIGDHTFYGCKSLASITIPNSVTTIGKSAFSMCRGLTSVSIPNSVTTIGSTAFYYCEHLTSVAIVGEGEWVNANNGSLFQYAKTLFVGGGITAIRGLQCAPTEVWCNAINPPICDDNTFTSYSGALHVPAEAMVAYFTAEYWQNFYDLHTDGGGKVSLSQSEAALDLGETLQLNAVVNPAGSTLVWESLNPNIATVSENGLVTAVGLGECDVIAHLSPNTIVADTCHVTVTPGEITLTLSEESLKMEIGDETTLTLTINPAGTSLTPVWASSDESVATVTDGGLVRAIAGGECDITATVLDKTVTCHVTVNGQVVITLDQMSVNVAVGSIVALYPSATPDVEVDLAVTSSDPTVAIARVVNRVNGAMAAPALVGTKMIQVIGIKDGRATITVGSADGLAIPATVIVTVGNGGSIPGDVDGDGRVSIADVTELIDLLLNGDEAPEAADVDGDGRVSIADVTEIIDQLLSNSH